MDEEILDKLKSALDLVEKLKDENVYLKEQFDKVSVVLIKFKAVTSSQQSEYEVLSKEFHIAEKEKVNPTLI